MIQSRFSYRTYIHIALAVTTLIYPFYLFFNRKETFGNHYNLKFIFVSSLMLLSCIWLILGIIKRINRISISDKEITLKNILLSEKHYDLKDFNGFETTLERSKYKSYEVLYLIKDNKSVVHISELHISNYKEIKKSIEKKLINLGYSPFSFSSYWKRYF